MPEQKQNSEQKDETQLPSSPNNAKPHVIGSQCPPEHEWWRKKTKQQQYLDSLSDWSFKRIYIEIRNHMCPDREEIPGAVMLAIPIVLGVIVIVLCLICM